MIRDTVCVSSAATRASYALSWAFASAPRNPFRSRRPSSLVTDAAPSSDAIAPRRSARVSSTTPAAARRTGVVGSRRLTDHGAFREIKRLDRTLSVVLGPERVLRAAHLSCGVFETLTRRARGVRRRARLAQRLPQRFQSGGILTLSNHRHLDGFDPRQRRVEFLHCGASRSPHFRSRHESRCQHFPWTSSPCIPSRPPPRHRTTIRRHHRRRRVVGSTEGEDAFEKISLRPLLFLVVLVVRTTPRVNSVGGGDAKTPLARSLVHASIRNPGRRRRRWISRFSQPFVH